jgi:group I intron endonuclease
MYPVYLITNAINSKQYVGCVLTDGKTIEQRLYNHLCGAGGATYLKRAIRCHGKEHFSIEQIGAGITPENALELEEVFIAELNTKAPNGYNLSDGGKGNPGYRFTDEQKQKLSEAHLGQVPWFKGRKNVPELKWKADDPRWTNPPGRGVKHLAPKTLPFCFTTEGMRARWKEDLAYRAQMTELANNRSDATIEKQAAGCSAAWTPERKAERSRQLVGNTFRKGKAAHNKLLQSVVDQIVALSRAGMRPKDIRLKLNASRSAVHKYGKEAR